MPLNQTMSEVIIRNTISNINFIIEYNLDINLPSEADNSQKFLNNLINVDKEDMDINAYFSDERENENATEKDKRLSSHKNLLNTENQNSEGEEGNK